MKELANMNLQVEGQLCQVILGIPNMGDEKI